MSITVLGSYSVGQAIPVAPLSLAQLAALLTPTIAQKAQLVGTQGISPTLPNPTALAAALAAAANPAAIAASLAAMPGNLAAVQAGLGAQIASLASLIAAAQALVSQLTSASAAGGVAAYAYQGQAGSFGLSLGSALGAGIAGGTGPAATVNALVLATESGATWTALSTLLKTTP